MRLNELHRYFLIVLLCLVCTAIARAQSAAEYGSLTSKAGTAAAGAKLPNPTLTLPTSDAHSPHLPLPSGESVGATNRRALQERAGPDAAEVSLRSVPDHAQVWIDAQFVGTTPLTLKLAPGHHRVRMSASEMDAGQQEVELLAKQTRQVVITLKSRYPQKVYLH